MCFIRERIVSSINGVGKTGQPHANKKKRERERLDYYLIPFTKNQLKMSKWIKDLNVRPEIIKLLDKNYTVFSFTWIGALSFWICHRRQGKQKQK